MRVLAFAADKSRCGHRLIWPARQLASEGADVVVHVPGWSQGDGWDGWETPDVVVIQRPMHERYLSAIDNFHRDGAAVVVEVDDDMTTLSSRHVLWPVIQPGLSPRSNWRILAECCRRADLVTASTSALAARYAGHGRFAVIPNHVPASYLDVMRREHEGVVVGWSGTMATHPHDLQEARGGIGRAVGSTGARFGVIGSPAGVQAALVLPDEPEAPGFVPLEEYPDAMGQLDVGVVPLEASAFNEAKSYLKGLEFAAVGVPFVASPTGPYRELAEHAGVLAKRPRDWEREVRRLVESPELRLERAGVARGWASGQTIERRAGMWLDAWERTRVLASKRRPVSA